MESFVKSCLFVCMLFVAFSPTVFGDVTPVSEDVGEITMQSESSASSTFTNFVETTYDDTDWALVTSNAILRENLCDTQWYEKPFDPCYGYDYNRYWEIPSNVAAGEAFPLDLIGIDTLDGLYVRTGYYFQLYDNTTKPENPDDLIPYGPVMAGPKYVSVDFWVGRAPNGFETGTFLVEGGAGGLSNYSIIIYKYDPNELIFTKIDDVNDLDCRSPLDDITYEICYSNTTGQTISDAYIVDYLPIGVDFDYLSGFPNTDPNYNDPNHTYTWYLGDLESGDSGCVTLEVTVNEYAEPGGELINLAELWSGDELIEDDTEVTKVCCWETDDPNIIFVDENAPGPNIGISWQTAYTDLQDAIARINEGCVGPEPEIWVADGTYNPGSNSSDSYEIPAGVKVYGGFGGYGVNESSIDQRRFKKYKSILSGFIGEEPDGNILRNNTVVTMGDDTLLDGFIVEQSVQKGVDGSNATTMVKNCVIKNNERRGLYCENGNLQIQWCKIYGNSQEGIFHIGSDYHIDILNCQIYKNQRDGIYTEESVLTIKNSQVYSNGSASDGYNTYYGINIGIPSVSPEICNNTIVYNTNEGINYFETSVSDPNDRVHPDVRNNILWYNNEDGTQFTGHDPNNPAMYNCTADADPNIAEDAYHNISCRPGFAYYDDPNGTYNFHIAYNSPCVDAGDSSVAGINDVDIDNEQRIYGTSVDIGADEVYSCDGDLSEDDIYHSLDWAGADGVINLREFDAFSRAWLAHDPNDPCYGGDPNLIDPNEVANWDSKCNLDTFNSPYDIDLYDLKAFADVWLWEACWHRSIRESYEVSVSPATESMMTAGLETGSSLSAQSLTVETEPTTAEQIDGIEEAVIFLNNLWEHDKQIRQAVTKQDWEDFINSLETTLCDLKTGL